VPYLLGIDIGANATKAAVCRRTGGRDDHGRRPAMPGADRPVWGPAQPVPLGVTARTVESALALAPTGALVATAGPGGGGDSVRGFLRQVGDDIPVRLGEDCYPPHVLVAAMARWVVDTVCRLEEEAPERVAVAHPTGWGRGRLSLLRAALDEAGLGGAALVTRARAVAENHLAAGRLPATGGVLAVYRLGASSTEVSLVVAREPGRWELLGSAECDEIGGLELQDAPPAEARALLQATVDLALRTVRGCGLTPADLAAVLIAGGGAAGPLVAEVLAAAIDVRVVRDDDPQLSVACGAALAARPQQPRQPGAELVLRPPVRADPALPDATTATWPEIGEVERRPAERPPRPPVRVAALKVFRR